VWPVMAGLLVGEAVVIWLTFGHAYSGHVNVGLLALVPNLVVLSVGAGLERTLGGTQPEKQPQLAGTGPEVAR